jgi:RNA polymerase sigma-70 factor (ECF subfamily)
MSDAREQSDEELARAAKRGDAAAYDALARRYLRPALAVAWQYTRRIADAEDVVQEAFHRSVRALADYDDRRPFSAWFYAIVRNVARSSIGRDGRRAALAPPAPLDDEQPAPATADPVLAGDLERAIEALPPMQHACIRLCDVEGFTAGEAAEMLDISEGTVRTHLHRARHRLRGAMGQQEGMLP